MAFRLESACPVDLDQHVCPVLEPKLYKFGGAGGGLSGKVRWPTANLTTLVSFNSDFAGQYRVYSLTADAGGTSTGRSSSVGILEGRGVRDRKDPVRLRQHADFFGDFNGVDGDTPGLGLTADAGGTFSARRREVGHTAKVRCLRSRRRSPVTPARRPFWRASMALMGRPAHEPRCWSDRRRRWKPLRLTTGGGANNFGTVFEIAKTSEGYASAPTTLVNFGGSDGNGPNSGLVADAAGDLFGTTISAGGSLLAMRALSSRSQRPSPVTGTPNILATFNGASLTTAPAVSSPTLRGTSSARRFRVVGRYRRGHGLRDRQDRVRLRQHADCFGQFQRRRWGWPSCRTDRRRRREPFRHDDGRWGVTTLATCSRSPKTKSGYASTPTVLVNFNGTPTDSTQMPH